MKGIISGEEVKLYERKLKELWRDITSCHSREMSILERKITSVPYWFMDIALSQWLYLAVYNKKITKWSKENHEDKDIEYVYVIEMAEQSWKLTRRLIEIAFLLPIEKECAETAETH